MFAAKFQRTLTTVTNKFWFNQSHGERFEMIINYLTNQTTKSARFFVANIIDAAHSIGVYFTFVRVCMQYLTVQQKLDIANKCEHLKNVKLRWLSVAKPNRSEVGCFRMNFVWKAI